MYKMIENDMYSKELLNQIYMVCFMKIRLRFGFLTKNQKYSLNQQLKKHSIRRIAYPVKFVIENIAYVEMIDDLIGVEIRSRARLEKVKFERQIIFSCHNEYCDKLKKIVRVMRYDE